MLIDSASLIAPEDAGQIIVTGSHGALVGGSAPMALRVDGFAAVFSDAGVGADGAGITRLPALDTRGIAGLTVSAASARIGDAASLYADGLISHANATARRLGARPGEPLKDAARGLGNTCVSVAFAPPPYDEGNAFVIGGGEDTAPVYSSRRSHSAAALSRSSGGPMPPPPGVRSRMRWPVSSTTFWR